MNQLNTDSSRLNKGNLFSGSGVRHMRACIAAVVIALLLAGNQLTASAYPQIPVRLGGNPPAGIIWVDPSSGGDCSYFHFHASSNSGDGYAAIRIWAGGANGTPLVDSYVSGYPSFYAPIQSTGYAKGAVNFPAQPNGTTLTARVYRALQPTPGSWDGGNFIDTTWQCTYGIYRANLWTDANNGVIHCDHINGFGGLAYSGSGYAAVRIWANSVNSTPLVDSYVPGYPAVYSAIGSDGSFANSSPVYYPAQPPGTTIIVRFYRTLSPTTGSWDGQNFINISGQCS